MYYLKKDYNLLGYRKSKTKYKKYDAKIQNKRTGKIVYVPFGDKRYENYHDKTGLNLYPHLLHGDSKRRKAYRSRHKHNVREDSYSPSWFSYYITW